ncbi:Hypothetical protein R9X50_00740400 [Acrodontium crateriforme]|uniref:DDHD domain-containing protein n=1 Tax=Acrodontium crateriforme TaxID=150365 RepID=A0AAQ3M9Q0_9PEZI|nr:Hypothetical protein R9X50_00740400 [Acrodontium crateriforme]
MTGVANQYVRHVLRPSEAPPPIEARFFYASPLPIDDPLSPLPPPASGGQDSAKFPPKPFSLYDNVALDKAWHELRQKILEYNEERGEKTAVKDEDSRPRTASSSSRDGKKRSVSRPVTPKIQIGRQAASSLGQVDGPDDSGTDETQTDSFDGPSSAVEVGSVSKTTGTPFIRAPSRQKVPTQGSEDRPTRPKFQAHDTYLWDDASHLASHSPPPEKRVVNKAPTDKVAVGVSRLHQVEMPALVMTPIYWEPVQDTAQVMRGTWFYKETMLPVEASVANMLEAGYIDLQVWTETWKDELNSAVYVGAEGEERIVHKLWPDKIPLVAESRTSSRAGSVMRGQALLRPTISNMVQPEPQTPEQLRAKAVEAACDSIDICNGPGGKDSTASGTVSYGKQGTPRQYASYGVIYANDKEARLLKPSLLPSAYYGRRPLANYIRKGHKLGITVVRGFDEVAWNKLHPSKTSAKNNRAEHGVASSSSGAAPEARRENDPDLSKADRPQVTDLILVIHGIGQKLSRRMESWHFTHAMNAFRREVHVEAGTKDVKGSFRPDMGGIMVLPVNWRHGLSFEDGGYRDGADDDPSKTRNEFTLDDITPDTLPSIRNIVSDVMLDIPYYMSHHQPKMIAAVIREANRVYGLWCANNPGFASSGRVHIIAHSLGSVMSVDILSRQPTELPPQLAGPPKADENLDHFIFPTHNLFLCGSPAGFFLLLKRAQLRPRLDHSSAAARADPSSNDLSVCGQQGDYGCLAVHNVYNILNGYDPVAYRLNATVDATYAALLKPAFVPSSTTSWFGGSSRPALAPPMSTNSSTTLTRLPSNMELETHDFTHESLAEARMLRLNDCGQLDFILRYDSGMLSIPYLSMLSAHSSYWLLKDFTRMIVVETGRRDGSEGVIRGMRAVKKGLGGK